MSIWTSLIALLRPKAGVNTPAYPGSRREALDEQARQPHREDHSDIGREARLRRHRMQMRQLAIQRSQYEDYVRQAKAAISGF